MSRTKQLGDVAGAAIMADVLRRGYRVLLPSGEDWPYEPLVLAADDQQIGIRRAEPYAEW